MPTPSAMTTITRTIGSHSEPPDPLDVCDADFPFAEWMLDSVGSGTTGAVVAGVPVELEPLWCFDDGVLLEGVTPVPTPLPVPEDDDPLPEEDDPLLPLPLEPEEPPDDDPPPPLLCEPPAAESVGIEYSLPDGLLVFVLTPLPVDWA